MEAKLPTILTNGKAEAGRAREEKAEERISEKRTIQKKEDQCVRKGRKVVRCFVAPEDRKVGLLKRRVGSYLGR